ncbi:MBL fold metallo-hydrolase [Kineosporia mesophila]|uniref:MBL fold metallo-hydrolase n=1 Tax=Kineosporia mesophila TaxID=566012 RepID=A0ABP7AIC4_9ACTN|nr:MBL fold metallo-hydrolase [Kineosporia mesophila]MCD5352411.1 MBL fold metallo-hydrolase [Kineosporia mesophila]
MKLTKHVHACVVLEDQGTTIVVDPGTFATNARDLLSTADAVLITHDHFDHFDVEAVKDVVAQRPDLPVYAPASVIAQIGAGHLIEATDGLAFSVGPVPVQVFLTGHAKIHPDLTMPDNAAYLIGDSAGGSVFHPGDTYLVPGVAVDTLLVPTSGPWTKLGEAVDFVRAVSPRQAVQIHEAMLSEIGQQSTAHFLSEKGLTRTPFTVVPVGESIEIAG